MRPSPPIGLLVLALVLGGATACPSRMRAGKKASEPPSGPSQPPPPPAPEVTPQNGAAEPETTRAHLARARQILAAVLERPLSAEQREQVDSGAAFIEQADAALLEGDLDRAAVLADKALALLQQIDKDTRPA